MRQPYTLGLTLHPMRQPYTLGLALHPMRQPYTLGLCTPNSSLSWLIRHGALQP